MSRFWMAITVVFALSLTISTLVNANTDFFNKGIDYYIDGERYEKNGKYINANDSFKNAIESLQKALDGTLSFEQKARAYLRIGISQYYRNEAQDAVKSLDSALKLEKGLKFKQQAEGYLYWGLLLAMDETVPREQVRKKFEKALGANPNLKFPTWLKIPRKNAYKMFKDVAKGTLIIKLSPLESKDWIILIDGKRLDSDERATVFNGGLRLLRNRYAVRGIYKKGSYEESIEKNVTIAANRGTICELTVKLPFAKGTLIIKLSPPEAKDWIILIDDKELGSDERATVFNGGLRLLENKYAVRGIYKKGSYEESIEKNATIAANRGTICELTVKLPFVEHEPPGDVPVAQEISLAFKVKYKKPKQIYVYYKGTMDRQFIRTANLAVAYNQRPHWWHYAVKLPSQDSVGEVEYFITIEYEGGPPIRYPMESYRICIVDDTSPKITLLEPPDNASTNIHQSIAFRVQVRSIVPVDEVRVYYDSARAQLSESSAFQRLKAKLSSDTYIGEIPVWHNLAEGDIWYFVTATNVEGTSAKSEIRMVSAK